jgi:hypothetical protein
MFVYPRYGGIILVHGKIGRKNVIFGYGASIKFDLPCCAEECILETNSWNWGEEMEDIMKQFRCTKVGIIERGIKIEKKNENKKRRVEEQEWRFLDTDQDLKDFLGLREIPEEMVNALK